MNEKKTNGAEQVENAPTENLIIVGGGPAAAAASGSRTPIGSVRSLPSRSQRLMVLRSWKKATIPGGIGSQKAMTR